MRIIVWGVNYAPELTGIAPFNTGLCEYLRERGHEVEMVTSFPYYPYWKKIPGDRGLLYRMDDVDSVPVHRCWHYVPKRVSTLKRMVHELTFGAASLMRVLFLARADLYVVVSPPLLLGPLAAFVAWLKRRPYLFHVQDLQPDAAVGLGMVKVGRLTRLLYKVEAWSYRHAVAVSGISQGMLEAYRKKGVPEKKIVLFPNWLRSFGRNIEPSTSDPNRAQRAAAFRKKFNIAENSFLAAYSGNLGKKQGLETLIEAAALLQDRKAGIVLLVVGDGAMRTELERQAADRCLGNVRMMPLLIESDYQGMLAAADISLILQAPGTGQYFFPSKLLSVLAARSPVLSVADDSSELAKAVAEGGFGVNVNPGSAEALAGALERLAQAPRELEKLAARTVWVNQFAASRVLGDFEKRLVRIVADRGDGV